MSRYTPLHAAPPVTLFHDGHCPLLPAGSRVAGKASPSGTHRVSRYIGMDASRALYAVLGYRRLVRFSCLPGVHSIMNAGYRFFARRRIWLGQWWEKRQTKC